MNGKSIIVYRNGTAIAATKSNKINRRVAAIETSNPTSGADATYDSGKKTWQVATSFLVLTNAAMQQALNDAGAVYTLVIGATGQTGTKHGLSGSAILIECSIDATVGTLCQGSFVFQGTGPLTSV